MIEVESGFFEASRGSNERSRESQLECRDSQNETIVFRALFSVNADCEETEFSASTGCEKTDEVISCERRAVIERWPPSDEGGHPKGWIFQDTCLYSHERVIVAEELL